MHEYFWDYDEFLYFKNSKVKEVMNVKLLNDNHLYWPDVGVDLQLDSIKNPQALRVVSKGNR